MKTKSVASIGHLCVACGTCMKVCPLMAISITNGIRANVDHKKCVGCGKCSNVCPASVIDIVPREVVDEN